MQSLVRFGTFPLMFETTLDSFLKGMRGTFKRAFPCEHYLSGHKRAVMKHKKNHRFLLISRLRVVVESSANTKEAIKQWSKHRTCMNKGCEVDFSAS